MEGEEETIEIRLEATHHKVVVASNAERRDISLVSAQMLQVVQGWEVIINVSSVEKLDIFHVNAHKEEVTNVSIAAKKAIKREIVPLNLK